MPTLKASAVSRSSLDGFGGLKMTRPSLAVLLSASSGVLVLSSSATSTPNSSSTSLLEAVLPSMSSLKAFVFI